MKVNGYLRLEIRMSMKTWYMKNDLAASIGMDENNKYINCVYIYFFEI